MVVKAFQTNLAHAPEGPYSKQMRRLKAEQSISIGAFDSWPPFPAPKSFVIDLLSSRTRPLDTGLRLNELDVY